MSLFRRRPDADELVRAGWVPPVDDPADDGRHLMRCEACSCYEFTCWFETTPIAPGTVSGAVIVCCGNCGKRTIVGSFNQEPHFTVSVDLEPLPMNGNFAVPPRKRAKPV